MKKTKNRPVVKKKPSLMINLTDERGKLFINPRNGKIVFPKEEHQSYRDDGFISLDYLQWELGFDLGQFIESGSDEDDPDWFCVDAASEVLMKTFANFDAAYLELLCDEGRDYADLGELEANGGIKKPRKQSAEINAQIIAGF